MTRHRLSDRVFGLMFAAVFGLIAVGGWFFSGAVIGWALIVAGGFAAVALVAPGALLPFNRLWGVLGHKLGRIVNFVLLGLFFFLFVLPLGLIIRLTGRDPMHRTLDPKVKTYWTQVTRHTDETTLRDMF